MPSTLLCTLAVQLVLLCFLVKISQGKFSHVIHVSQASGHDTDQCWKVMAPGRQNTPCKTLNYALKHAHQNSTEVIIEPNVYNLTENVTLERVYEFAMTAANRSGNAEVTIICSDNVGLSFIRSRSIKLNELSFINCCTLHPSTVGAAFEAIGKAHVPFNAAVFFAYCDDLVIVNCKVTSSPGIGLILYDVGGVINVNNSIFSYNIPSSEDSCSDNANAGGGVYFEYTFDGALPPFGINNEYLAYQNNNNITFYNCTFENNQAPEQCFLNMIEFPSGDDHMPFGRGGGLSIFIRGTSTNNTFIIQECHFLANKAVWGSGLFLEFQGHTQNNDVTVQQCAFRNNSNSTAGGAVRSGIAIWSDAGSLKANNIVYEDCMFIDNSAIMGGGVSHYGPYYCPICNKDHRRVIFKNCQWINNQATIGCAISLATSVMDIALGNLNPKINMQLKPYVVMFHNCSIIDNDMIPSDDNVIGQGALYSYGTPMVFDGDMLFENNTNTALVLDGAIVKIANRTTFHNNKGIEGGAIGMYGPSLIDLMPGSKVNLTGNQAKERGGAIFVRESGPPVVAFNTTELNTHGCFLAYGDTISMTNASYWNTTVVFADNVAAPGGGNSVYATTLRGCRRTGEGRVNNDSLQWNFVHYFRDNKRVVNIKEEVSTDPIRIQVVRSDWSVAPSEKFNAKVRLYDEKDSLVQGVVNITIHGTSGSAEVALDLPSPLLLVKKENKVTGLMLKGKVNSKFSIELRTVGSQFIIAKEGNLFLEKCLPGFEQRPGIETCKCLPRKIFDGLSRCDGNDLYLKNGYWGGSVDGKFATHPCPSGYCTEVETDSREYKFNLRNRCRANRNDSSILCGSCKDGFSVYLGNEKCGRCTNSHLWLLLVFFLSTLILVLLVLKIDLDIFTAYLNSWLYSYQIIDVLLEEGEDLDVFMEFIVGIANWRIPGYGSCLFSGLNNISKLGINYGLPFYVLFLLFVLSKIGKLFPRCYINRNVSKALCTLLVLCYTNITMISFSILHYVKVGDRWVLFDDGEISFYEDWRTHLPFTIIAVLLLMFFVLLLPMMLLFTPWFMNKFPFLLKFRLFFDLFQSCFEDQEKQRNYRWFAAFYFLCRIGILCISLYLPFGPLKRSLLEASCVLICGVCLYLKPYNTRYNWLNTLDAVLLVNLSLITIFSSGRTVEAGDTTEKALWYVVDLLAYIPLIYSLVLVGFKGWEYVSDEIHWHNLRNNREEEGSSTVLSTAGSHGVHGRPV